MDYVDFMIIYIIIIFILVITQTILYYNKVYKAIPWISLIVLGMIWVPTIHYLVTVRMQKTPQQVIIQADYALFILGITGIQAQLIQSSRAAKK